MSLADAITQLRPNGLPGFAYGSFVKTPLICGVLRFTLQVPDSEHLLGLEGDQALEIPTDNFTLAESPDTALAVAGDQSLCS